MYILDTDHISLFLQNNSIVKQRISIITSEEIATTIVSVQEQTRGWLNVINQCSNSDRVLWGYTGLSKAVQFFNTVPVLQFDRAAYNIFLGLKSQKIRIGTQDLRIAAIALAVGGAIVTRNQRDFGKIPGLTLENWTV